MALEEFGFWCYLWVSGAAKPLDVAAKRCTAAHRTFGLFLLMFVFLVHMDGCVCLKLDPSWPRPLSYMHVSYVALLGYCTIFYHFFYKRFVFFAFYPTKQDAPLGALGLDSMEAMQLMALLEERFSVSCSLAVEHVSPSLSEKQNTDATVSLLDVFVKRSHSAAQRLCAHVCVRPSPIPTKNERNQASVYT